MTVKKASPTAVISVIVPTLNEAGNVKDLFKRINKTFTSAKVAYKVIVVDDHSSDGTWELLITMAKKYPAVVFQKVGESGKAQSLVEAFAHVDTPYASFLDADLQYPPEALPQMLAMIQRDEADVVVAKRTFLKASFKRRFISAAFRNIFGKLLWNLDCDVQSGQKVFRSEILKRISIQTKPWSFDLEFLVACRNGGYTIGEYDIEFSPRTSGQSNVHLVKSSLQVGWETIKLRFRGTTVLPISEDDRQQQVLHSKSTNK